MANIILASLLKPTNHKWKEQVIYIEKIEGLVMEERIITSSSPGYHVNKMVKIANEFNVDYLIYLRRELSEKDKFEMKYFWALHKSNQENHFNGCVISQDEFLGNTAKDLFQIWNENKDNPEWLIIHEAEFKRRPKLDWKLEPRTETKEVNPFDKQIIEEEGQTYFEECLKERNKRIEAIYENARRELLLKPGEVLVMIDNNFYQFESYKDYKIAKYGNNNPVEEISLDELMRESKKSKRKKKPIKRFPKELTEALNSSRHSQYSFTVGNEERYQRIFEMIENPKDKWDWEWINNLKINRNETIKQGRIIYQKDYTPQS